MTPVIVRAPKLGILLPENMKNVKNVVQTWVKDDKKRQYTNFKPFLHASEFHLKKAGSKLHEAIASSSNLSCRLINIF